MIDPEKEREDFISIRQLVALIAKKTGRTEQQAAALVSANLERNPKWRTLTLCEWRPSFGCLQCSAAEQVSVKQRLARWGDTGDSQPSFEDSDEIPF